MRHDDPLDPRLTPAWEAARDELRRHADVHALDAYQYVFESPRVICSPDFAAYAAPSFPEKRPLLEAALDLCSRIYSEFHYDRRATTVSTPVTEVLESRRGVCQDFAHFTLACLRSMGLAARYVSGYLLSDDLTGSEASHAWVSVFCPGFGWFDLDPTNNVRANGHHLILAWGRDYSDVAPVKGVALGGGEQVINVSVSVRAATE
jgi:transglutaminase-like putative cysteine protease